MSRNKGEQIEQLACAWLEAQGLSVVSKNYSSRLGEIDLVMQLRETLVFVEVRYRESDRYGSAAESVTAKKQARIVKTAAHFLSSHPKYARHNCRFDVIALSGAAASPQISWIENAFSA